MILVMVRLAKYRFIGMLPRLSLSSATLEQYLRSELIIFVLSCA